MVGHRALGVATVGVLLAGLGAAQLVPGGTPLSSTPAQAGELVAYDGCAPLLQSFRDELARTATPYGWGGGGYGGDVLVAEGARALGGSTTGGSTTGAGGVAAPQAASADSATALGSGASGTNLQERGVDEPDLVKLVGGRLYTVSNGALQVLQAGSSPRQLGRLAIPGAQGQSGPYAGADLAYGGAGTELLVEDDRVLVIEQGHRTTGAAPAGEQAGGGASGSATTGIGGARGIAPAAYLPTTVLRLADVSDPAEPRWLETYELDGSYLSARLVDGSVRLVTRTRPAPAPIALPDAPARTQQQAEAQQQRRLAAHRAAARRLSLEEVLPRATREADGRTAATGAAVRCADVSYAPAAAGGGLLLVTTLRPEDGLEPVDSAGVQADGELVYATADRLFVATSRWGTSGEGVAQPARVPGEVSTQLHAFDTTDARDLRYVGTGSVDGYVLGRWALSWHEGSMRVATTTGAPWGGTAAASSSSVVVLREQGGRLAEVGRVDGLGKGEQIKAVRYLGDLATVVTFRQTDPLYVLDLSEPAAPALRGELKVPGFSTYLHPIGDDRLLGIGMEADERTGRTTGVQASVYDLSDLSKPVQVDRLQLGQGHSEALQESRAFGYDPQRRLAVLPFQDGQGASSGLGIRVAPDGRLSMVGRLAVTPQDGVSDCGRTVVAPEVSCGYRGAPPARRVVLDGERVHLLTGSTLITGTSAGMQRTGAVAF